MLFVNNLDNNKDISNVENITISGSYKINNIEVLSSSTLGTGVNNSFLTTNTGNLLNIGTLSVRTDTEPTVLMRDEAGTQGGNIAFGNTGHGVGRGISTLTTNFPQGNDVVVHTVGTVGGGAPGDIGLQTSGGYVKLESESGKFGINVNPAHALDVIGDCNLTGVYKIGAVNVFDNVSTLATGVVNSSLTSVGVLTGITVSGSVDINMADLGIINFEGSGASDRVHLQVKNSVSMIEVGVCGGNNDFFTGTIDGDSFIRSANKNLHIGSFASGTDMIFYTNNTEVMRLKNTTGRLGIGAASPSQLLHLNISSSGTNVKCKFTNSDTTNGLEFGLNGSNTVFQMKHRDNFDMEFYTNDIKRFVIKNDGRASFGSNSPATSAQLDLQSTTGALLLNRMTTTQRDALTAVNGMLIYNSTLNIFQEYENGAWIVNGDIPIYSNTITSAQNINNNTTTIIDWTGTADTRGGFSESSGVITLPSLSGLYQIIYNVIWDSNGTGRRQVFIEDGSGGKFAFNSIQALNGSETAQTGSHILNAASSSTFTIRVYQNSGIGLDIDSGTYTTSVSVVRIGNSV